MGDRVTFAFQEKNGDVIYLYGHWAGYQMMSNLAHAIDAARPRWNDEGYATRIAISQLINDEWSQELSWGITTYFCDSEHSVPVVNWADQTVKLIPHELFGAFTLDREPKFTMSLDSFVQRFAKMPVGV
jgi:hypothetical protein